jgi:hypothetical protein
MVLIEVTKGKMVKKITLDGRGQLIVFVNKSDYSHGLLLGLILQYDETCRLSIQDYLNIHYVI